MLTKMPKSWGVTSDSGYSVVRSGSPLTQFCIEYSEGDRRLHYYLENLMPGFHNRLVVSEIGPWQAPHEADDISQEQQEAIARRIVEAMSFLGDTLEIVYDHAA